MKLCENFNRISEYENLYCSIKATHQHRISKALKFSYAFEFRFHQIDTNQLLHSMYILREIPRLTKMSPHILMSDEYYKNEIFDSEDSNLTIDMAAIECPNIPDDTDNVDLNFIESTEDAIENVTTVNKNVQKKLVAFRETFIDRNILNSLPEEFLNRNAVCDDFLSILITSMSCNLNFVVSFLFYLTEE